MGNLKKRILGVAATLVVVAGCTSIGGAVYSALEFVMAFGQSGCPRMHITISAPPLSSAAAGKGLSPYFDTQTKTPLFPLAYPIIGATEFVIPHNWGRFVLQDRFRNTIRRMAGGQLVKLNNFLGFTVWTKLQASEELRMLAAASANPPQSQPLTNIQVASITSRGGGVALYYRTPGTTSWNTAFEYNGGTVAGQDADTVVCSSGTIPIDTPQELLLATSVADGPSIEHPWNNPNPLPNGNPLGPMGGFGVYAVLPGYGEAHAALNTPRQGSTRSASTVSGSSNLRLFSSQMRSQLSTALRRASEHTDYGSPKTRRRPYLGQAS